MISRVCYCFRLSRVSYSLYCNKLSVHNTRVGVFCKMHALECTTTRGVQYVMKTARYIPTFYIYTLYDYFHSKACFLAI